MELGLPLEAWKELEAVEPPPRRAEVPVPGIKVAIFHALEPWEAMEEVRRYLATVQPWEIFWFMWLATASREILLRAMVRFPKEAATSFNLACYAAQSGNLEDVRDSACAGCLSWTSA